ncbi:MAG: family serine peptidase, partial [Flavipsychrobacter sp.]|nr:family serine peptidase [Flavipsychrobacter sp.]
TTTDTVFSFGGMSLTDRSYVAVQPVIDGINGYRSVAVSRIANDGNCNNPSSAGDIVIEKVISPATGRMFTSTELGALTLLKLRLRNLYGADCNNYTVSWQVNTDPWQSVSNPGTIPAKDAALINVTGLSLGTTGTYKITVAISNMDAADPQKTNDTLSFTVLNLPNDPVDLSTAFTDDFESMGIISVTHDSVGMSPNAHWDFFNSTDTGRMRSFMNDELEISGIRSVSLDDIMNVHTGSKNTFVGTFNLSNYDTANTEVRLDFDYVLHSTPKSSNGNLVTARGSDTSAWNTLYTYDLSQYPGYLRHVLSASVTDAVRANKHNFTSSSQISFGQNDTSLIAGINYGNGLTMDNVKIYTVTNDAVLASIVSPPISNCGLPSTVPLVIKVHNGVANTLHNVQLFYNFDNGTTYTGVIDSIKGKTDINYTFGKELDITPGATHNINVWLAAAGDSYTLNDSILNYHIRNTQIISSYPYLENFENGNGGFYSDGINNSWQYGMPTSPKTNKAASGTKAWKTNLSGNYNNLETSYLYSPCFDISGLSVPMLSFSTAMEIENCGSTLCDAAFVEYSFDGANWRKLGRPGQGTNWYDSVANVWKDQAHNRWHVATTPIAVLGSGTIIRFRFVLYSDPGATFEGVSIDDVHVYDYAGGIAPATGVTSVSKDLTGNTRGDYTTSDQLVAAVQPSQDVNNAEVTLYKQADVANATATQYTMPRSYTIKTPKDPSGNTNVRLYLLDSEVVQVMKDSTCPSCTPLKDAYSLGITSYDNTANPGLENASLTDDTGGVFTYYPHSAISWVPYDKGYYADFTTKTLSEFWFNNGGPTGTIPANSEYLNFIAYRSGTNVATYWYSLIDTAVTVYTLQRSNDSIHFETIIDTAAKHIIPGQYSYTDAVNFTPDSILYYRLKWSMTGQKGSFYSPIRRIDINDSGASLVTLDAFMTTHSNVLVNWKSYIDPAVNSYKLERAIGDKDYTTISTPAALHHYGQQYFINDAPGNGMRTGTQIHYRLTALLSDGNQVVLPVKTLIWIENNAIVDLYPNPTYDGRFTISWHADAGTIMSISITDAIGRNVNNTSFTATGWNNTSTIQTLRGPKGVYFARINVGGKMYGAKIVFE